MSNPGRSKERRVPVSPVVAKKQISVESSCVSGPSYEAALEKKLLRSRVQEKVVVITVMLYSIPKSDQQML